MEKKCKVVLLPTDNKSKIFKHDTDNSLHLFNDLREGNSQATAQYLYILSDDEIKELP